MSFGVSSRSSVRGLGLTPRAQYLHKKLEKPRLGRSQREMNNSPYSKAFICAPDAAFRGKSGEVLVRIGEVMKLPNPNAHVMIQVMSN